MATASSIPVSGFAPAERLPVEIVHQTSNLLSAQPLSRALLDSVLNYVFVLNRCRQIVYASRNFEELVSGTPLSGLIGQRPGEALGCAHAFERTTGCGTSEFCSECGAVHAILKSLSGTKDVRECRLTRLIHGNPEAMDLLVMAAPLQMDGECYSIFSVMDISHEKRRRAMERIFFHDAINTVGGLAGLMEMLRSTVSKEIQPDLEMAQVALHDLLDQIQSQKDLAAAEKSELPIVPTSLNSGEILSRLIELYRHHPIAEGRTLCVSDSDVPVDWVSDRSLLLRVLGNLIKNALEASKPGQTVSIQCCPVENKVQFSVNNPGYMPRSAQLQVFNRSFSTKGPGRGLGTYSVKLLTEKYLKGTVSFTSTLENGTTFFVTLPQTLPSPAV